MKNLQKLSIALVLLFSASLFAQRSTFWDGTYKMDYGNQTMKIVTQGGKYYKAYFSGDCNAHTAEGSVDGNTLIFPIVGGSNRDMIMLSHQGNKINVSVRGQELMRDACRGASVEGLYSSNHHSNYSSYNENYHEHKNYNYDNFNNSYKTRDSHKYGTADVYDLMKISAPLAYEKLKDRGFRMVKGGGKYKVWYNEETNQCIKTVSIDKHIHDVLKSTHCN